MPNVSVSNTPGLYIGSGASGVLNSAQQLYSLLSNSGNVNFALINNNTAVQSYFIGNIPGLYTNANVASYLPVYSGNLQANNIQVLGNVYLAGSNNPAIVGQVDAVTTTILANTTGTTGNLATINLPAAGVWEIDYYGRVQYTLGSSTNNRGGSMAIIDTSGNIVANTTVALGSTNQNAAGSGGAKFVESSGSRRIFIETFAPTTYYLRVYLNTSTDFTDGAITFTKANPQVLISSVAYTANLSYTGNISANGNITTSNYFIGDGSQLTGITAVSSYGNANVATYLPTYTGSLANSSTIITINANIGAFQTYANSAFGPTTYGNSNVAAYLPTYTGSLANSSSIQTINANLGAFQTYANATFGTSSYGNANVAAYLPVYGGVVNALSITGVAGQDITIEPDGTNDVSLNADTIKIGDNNTNATIVTRGTGNLQLSTHFGDANQGNITLVNGANGNIKLWPNGSGIVEAAGNVQASYYLGDGSQLINLPIQSGTYSNTNVAAYLPTYTGSLAQSTTIIDLYSNAATQATAINSINANLGAYQTYANATFTSYSNTNVAAYLTSGATGVTANLGNIITTNGLFWANGTTALGSSYGNTQVAAYIQNTNLNSGGLNMLANVSYNNNFIRTAILETTTEKTSNIGAITGTVTIDANVGPIQRATLVGNITINTTQMSNFATGESVTLVLTQDGVGSRLLTSNLKYAGGSKTLSTAAASVDTISITYDGSIYLAALVKGYA